jgi:hypothetical protein
MQDYDYDSVGDLEKVLDEDLENGWLNFNA